MMTSDEYVNLAIKTENRDFITIFPRIKNSQFIRLDHASKGMITEVGEFVDELKKWEFYGKSYTTTSLVEELGDLMWYIAIACDAIGVPLEVVMEKNIAKLKARYGEKFNEEDALNRNLEQERMVLAYEQTKKNIVHYFEHGNQNTICNQNLLSVDNATDATQFVTCVDCKNAMVAIHFNRMQ